jgi:hypothetical protein
VTAAHVWNQTNAESASAARNYCHWKLVEEPRINVGQFVILSNSSQILTFWDSLPASVVTQNLMGVQDGVQIASCAMKILVSSAKLAQTSLFSQTEPVALDVLTIMTPWTISAALSVTFSIA